MRKVEELKQEYENGKIGIDDMKAQLEEAKTLQQPWEQHFNQLQEKGISVFFKE